MSDRPTSVDVFKAMELLKRSSSVGTLNSLELVDWNNDPIVVCQMPFFVEVNGEESDNDSLVLVYGFQDDQRIVVHPTTLPTGKKP